MNNKLEAVRPTAAWMRRTTSIVIAGVALAACTQQKKPELPTYPASLQAVQSQELGQLVLQLMPEGGTTTIPWDFQANNANIVWKSTGYETGIQGAGESTRRRGVARVNVQGGISTVLHQRKEELGWGVTYTSRMSPKFGVERIELTPGGDEQCFGTPYTGCAFDPPAKSLADAGILADVLCKTPEGGEMTVVYRAKHDGRQPMIVVWWHSEGSGGASSEVDMEVDDGKAGVAECGKLAPAPAQTPVSDAAQPVAPVATAAQSGSVSGSLTAASNSAWKARFDAATTSYASCLKEQAPLGDYTSSDGGDSAIRLMGKCFDSMSAYVDACKLGGKTEGDCTVNAGILSQLALKLIKK